VLVDGARRPTTRLLLSHWPGSRMPPELARDLSTESALAYLGAPWAWSHGASVVTCDHLDEDALAGLYVLSAPEDAIQIDRALTSLARAGDFDVVGSLEMARAAWGLRSLLAPGGWPAGAAFGVSGPFPSCAEGVPETLVGLVGRLARDPSRFRALWAEEDATYQAGLRALARGEVVVEELPAVSLAVVTCKEHLPPASATVGHPGRRLPVHPAAIHGVTSAPRILVAQGGTYTYYDRYESWVALATRRLPARRDLSPLAVWLRAAETRRVEWTADAPSSLVPVLASEEGASSGLSLGRVVGMLSDHLIAAPPAWWPHGTNPGDGRARISGWEAPRGGTSGQARTRWRGRLRPRPST